MPFKKGFINGLKPEENLTVSEWADKHRILPREGSSEPGRWRTSRTPYLREIMDELSPQSATTEVVVIKGTQLGFTELGNNVLFYYAHLHPCPMLQVLHTEDIARTHAKTKIWPSIEAMEILNSKIKKSTSNKTGSSTLEIVYPGGTWKLGWAQTKSTFASVSRRVVICDDINRWPQDVGGEGNPIALAKKRADTFVNKKIYMNSTPTIVGASNIGKEFEESDKRLYYMPCPKCKKLITFEKENFVYEHKDYELIGEVKYKCPKCEHLISEHEKTWMMDEKNGAKWIATNHGREKRGYRLPSYYSPVGWLSWREIFKEYLLALKEEQQKNEEYMKVWVNTRDARDFEPKKIKRRYEDILLLKVEIEPNIVPKNTAFLTMAVDVQLDHFWFEIRAMQYGNSTHTILAGKVWNWWELEDIFRSYYKDSNGKEYAIRAVAIDSGYRTDEVYDFCARNSDICLPIKGSDKMNNPWRVSEVQKDGVTTGLSLYVININYFKDMLSAKLNRSIELKKEKKALEDGIFTLNKDINKLYALHYTSETKVKEVNKKTNSIKYYWKIIHEHADNHLWDCGVYNTFLGEWFGIRHLKPSITSKKRVKKREHKSITSSSSSYLDEF